MEKVAILCNGFSSKVIERKELITQLSDAGFKVCVGEIFDGKINQYYEKNSIIFLPIEASRNNMNPFKEIKSILSIKRNIRKLHINSVIIYGVKNHAAMSIGSFLGGAKKIICIVNGSGNLFRIGGIKGNLLRFVAFPMLKIAYYLSSSICFQNRDDLNLFRNKHLISKNKNVFVTGGSGVNLSLFPFEKLPKQNRFLYLARITSSKGIKEFIAAAYAMKEKKYNCIFDVYGDVDNTVEDSINDVIEQAVRDRVINYHGRTEDVAKVIANCRFFVYPSYYPEGVSRCLLQALSVGRPVITCNTPGCKETVVDGVNGFLVEKKDVLNLVDKMEYLINHPKECDKMGVESRKIAEDKFDVVSINNEIINNLLK